LSHDQPPRPRPEPADGDLLAPGMLHELRQPLMAAGAAALLLERALGAPLLRHADWRMLRNQLARIGEILAGYEELLRSEAAAPSAFEVEPVVARAIDLLAHRVRPLAPRFTFENGGRHQGFGAPGALVHAATNLLSNALDAVESAAGAGRITVRVLGSRAGGVAVRVSDEGTGIPPELRGRIFEPRFTTKEPGKGTGLGLHIARRLIGRFGGSVYLVDERDPDRLPWAVTEFCIEMPAPPNGAEVRS
jgi:signal transduction histidine kinase